MNIIKYITKNWVMILIVVLVLMVVNMTVLGNGISLRELPGKLSKMIVIENMSNKKCDKGKDCKCK